MVFVGGPTMMSVASVMSRPASEREAYISATSGVGTRSGCVARLRVNGAMTMRFFRACPPTVHGVKRFAMLMCMSLMLIQYNRPLVELCNFQGNSEIQARR